jgi:hypothetical protein
VTLALSIPRNVAAPAELRLEPGGLRLPLFPTDLRRADQRLITKRFRVAGEVDRVAFVRPPRGPRPPRLELYRWDEP